MRGETDFNGDNAQVEALRWIAGIAIESKRDNQGFTICKLYLQQANNDINVLLNSVKTILGILFGNSISNNSLPSSSVTCCWNTLLYVGSKKRLVGTITWFSTEGSGAFVKVVFGDKTTFALYDTGYTLNVFGYQIERSESHELGLPRSSDTKSNLNRQAFLEYALGVSQDRK